MSLDRLIRETKEARSRASTDFTYVAAGTLSLGYGLWSLLGFPGWCVAFGVGCLVLGHKPWERP